MMVDEAAGAAGCSFPHEGGRGRWDEAECRSSWLSERIEEATGKKGAGSCRRAEEQQEEDGEGINGAVDVR